MIDHRQASHPATVRLGQMHRRMHGRQLAAANDRPHSALCMASPSADERLTRPPLDYEQRDHEHCGPRRPCPLCWLLLALMSLTFFFGLWKLGVAIAALGRL